MNHTTQSKYVFSSLKIWSDYNIESVVHGSIPHCLSCLLFKAASNLFMIGYFCGDLTELYVHKSPIRIVVSHKFICVYVFVLCISFITHLYWRCRTMANSGRTKHTYSNHICRIVLFMQGNQKRIDLNSICVLIRSCISPWSGIGVLVCEKHKYTFISLKCLHVYGKLSH